MSLPAALTEPAAWQIVWDEQQLDFVFKPLLAPSETKAESSASAPNGAIGFNLDAMTQMVVEARKKAREKARRTQMLQDLTKYRQGIESLQLPATYDQHHSLFLLQDKLSGQYPIRICPGRDDKPTPEQRSPHLSSDQDNESHEKKQPYLAISTAWKVMTADIFLYRPETREACRRPGGHYVIHVISDFFELYKATTAKEAKKMRKKQRAIAKWKKEKAQATSSTTSVSANMGSTNEDMGRNNTNISGTRVPRLVYIMGRLVICQPHTDEDWVLPTVFVVAVELNKNINSGRPVWLIRDDEPSYHDWYDYEDEWELKNANLSMERLSAIWPMMEGKQAFGAARLAGSLDDILDAESCLSLSEVGASVWDSMDMGSWAMVAMREDQEYL
jgi:hypothetical protein